MLSHDNPGLGFNALTLKYEDMYEAGIIDSAKAIKSAFNSPSSIASMFLTMKVCVIKND